MVSMVQVVNVIAAIVTLTDEDGESATDEESELQ